jgi:HEXXH motif-containing protein
MLSRLEVRRIAPAIFARYLELVEAVQSGADERAGELFVEIDRLCDEDSSLRIAPFSRGELGEDYVRYPEILFTSDYGTQPITEISDVEFTKVRDNLESGLELLTRISPTLAGEIETLWLRIYVGESNPEFGGRKFGGVTSFLLWGATFLNAKAYGSPEMAVDFLVHESTHSLLFALSAEEPLVLNRLEDRYPSPLRTDPRPMDGIYHATLVSARVAWVFQLWLDSGEVGDQDRIGKIRDRAVGAFRDGAETVRKDGKLSSLGSDLFSQASDVMSGMA